MTHQNLDLQELVSEIKIQHAQKADYIVPAKSIKMLYDSNLYFEGSNCEYYNLNEIAHSHFADKLNIPNGYYQRMLSSTPELLSKNVNTWLEMQANTNYMLRTFETNGGNIARAVLSDRYNALDNYDVLFAALEAIKLAGLKVEIKECSITDKRMYVNIVAPQIEVQAEAALRNYLKIGDRSHVGDGVVSGITISNSEVGHGSYEIRARAVILRCNNGLIVKDDRFRRVHLGAKLEGGEITWSEGTKQKNYELVMSQTKDAINTFLSEGYLTGIVQKITAASNQKLDQPIDTVQNVIKLVSNKITLADQNKDSILNYFVTSGDHAASGIFQALTHEAQVLNADDRFELESYAFEILPAIKDFDKPYIAKN